MSKARYREARVGGCVSATLEERAGGVKVLRSSEALDAFPERLSDRLAHWAQVAPERTFAAKRDASGQWQRITYAQMLARAKSVGQFLATRPLSAERPIAILSDNDLEHLTLALGAMWVGVPYTPISPAYSLMSQDFGKLRHIAATVTPGLVFASGPQYERAIRAMATPDMDVVLANGTLQDQDTLPFSRLLDTAHGPQAEAAHAQVGPDTIVKFLFTSGSTKQPKGVVNTHRMMCANLQMIAQAFAFLQDEPPVLVDWLPWNHTFGGNHNVGITLYNGGTLYIDEGKPTASGIGQTLRNLREIAPTIYFNVPKGFEEIASAMDHDAQLRETLFSKVRAFMFSGAGLSQAVWDKLDAHAERTVGERIRILTGLGMTETAPSCTFAVGTDVRSGHIGLPCPGVEVKLVPAEGKTEIRFKGPNVMPHYWRAPEQTAEAFDEDGFYKTGDAVKFIDPAQPLRGLMFDGRIAEDFKLSTGTFVSVGPLRARLILDGSPCVQDVVVAGLNRDDVGILVFPRIDECRKLAGLAADVPPAVVLKHPKVVDFFQSLVDHAWHAGTGSANRVARALLLVEPPSIDKGEITDKGSINQRAVLTHRAALVDALYDQADGVLLPRRD
ncbi:feruloyl-CoA synthase [Piscinibacter terrae]|uniref:Feruloyl-CoA synthase n=1 Tax=Piscinibacter terrae TaxID=2496871 RepID=A0A3N7HW12_9BURK|nr:feruloyl-CoA synthase [Albitalea terrae]RQP26570.1 feruloyl-CoA synthase [Albitalea terrae]